jgi:hypothetical protein
MADSSARRQALRVLALAQSVIGVVLALQPYRVVAVVGLADDPPPTFILRVLGVRQVAQGAAQLRSPTPAAGLVGAAIDGSHALSLVPVIAFDRRHRRAAVISASFALAMAAVGGLISGRP